MHVAHEHLSDEFEKKKGEHQTRLKSVKVKIKFKLHSYHLNQRCC